METETEKWQKTGGKGKQCHATEGRGWNQIWVTVARTLPSINGMFTLPAEQMRPHNVLFWRLDQTHVLVFFKWDEKYDHVPRYCLTQETEIPRHKKGATLFSCYVRLIKDSSKMTYSWIILKPVYLWRKSSSSIPTSGRPSYYQTDGSGHNHGDIPQQANEQHAAWDSFPPVYPFWTGVFPSAHPAQRFGSADKLGSHCPINRDNEMEG